MEEPKDCNEHVEEYPDTKEQLPAALVNHP